MVLLVGRIFKVPNRAGEELNTTESRTSIHASGRAEVATAMREARTACARQARGDGARPHGVSEGRHGRWRRGDHVLLAPPFIVDASLVDTIMERLGDAIDAATVKTG
jgi:adenosylmethionine-8-amino-7-oxononanoate aminotransferase